MFAHAESRRLPLAIEETDGNRNRIFPVANLSESPGAIGATITDVRIAGGEVWKWTSSNGVHSYILVPPDGKAPLTYGLPC
jgi:hypothetical protein